MAGVNYRREAVGRCVLKASPVAMRVAVNALLDDVIPEDMRQCNHVLLRVVKVLLDEAIPAAMRVAAKALLDEATPEAVRDCQTAFGRYVHSVESWPAALLRGCRTHAEWLEESERLEASDTVEPEGVQPGVESDRALKFDDLRRTSESSPRMRREWVDVRVVLTDQSPETHKKIAGLYTAMQGVTGLGNSPVFRKNDDSKDCYIFFSLIDRCWCISPLRPPTEQPTGTGGRRVLDHGFREDGPLLTKSVVLWPWLAKNDGPLLTKSDGNWRFADQVMDTVWIETDDSFSGKRKRLRW